jgi:hypothetical protein
MVKQWDVLLEYRVLKVIEDNLTRKSRLVGVDHHLVNCFM